MQITIKLQWRLKGILAVESEPSGLCNVTDGVWGVATSTSDIQVLTTHSVFVLHCIENLCNSINL